MTAQRTLGINGIGRIGKLTLWHHLGRDDFDRFVVNTGRPVGTSLESVVQYLSKDSTYGPLHRFLFGRSGVRDMSVVDEERGLISAYGKEILILREARNPKDIPWRDNGVALVVDATGTFRDPHLEADAAREQFQRIDARFALDPPALEDAEIVRSKREGRELSLIVRGNIEKVVAHVRAHRPESMNTQALTLEEIFVATLA